MTERRESFIFYRSFFEATAPLNKEEKAELFDAICMFALEQEESKLQAIPEAMFKLIKPQLEANYKKYLNGKEPKKKKVKAKRKQNVSKSEGNANVNDNVNVNVNDIQLLSPKQDFGTTLEKFVEAWNSKHESHGLPRTIKITEAIKSEWRKVTKQYTKEDLMLGVSKYLGLINKNIKKKKAGSDDGYLDHRFNLHDFLSQKNGLQKFINS